MNRSLIYGAMILGSSARVSAEPIAPTVGLETCAAVNASARLQAMGYRHVVTLENHCLRPVSCEVWTNVDPLPHLLLSAKPGEVVEVATRIGSPSRDVRADKQCHFF